VTPDRGAVGIALERELPMLNRVIEMRTETSDGIAESTNAAGEDFGDGRLRALRDEHCTRRG
jgi:hypothetical protein